MLYLITLFNLVLLFLYRNKRAITIWVTFAIFLIATFNYGTADFGVYYGRYLYYDSTFFKDQTEPLYTLVIRLARTFGMPYRTFLGMEYAVIFGSFYFFISKHAKIPNIVLIWYIIWPFCRDVSGVRTSLGCAFIYIAFSFFIKEEKKYLIPYVIFVLIGGMFHYGMLFYLILLLIPMVPNTTKSGKNRLIIIFVLLFLIEVMFLNVIPNLPFTGTLMKKISYVFGRSTQSGNIITAPGTFRTLFMFIVYYYLHGKVERKLCKDGDYARLKIAQRIYYVNLYVLLAIPLYVYVPDLCRIQQCIAILCYIEFSFFFSDTNNARKIKKSELIFFFECLGYAIIYLFIIVLKTNEFNSILRGLFEQNILNLF